MKFYKNISLVLITFALFLTISSCKSCPYIINEEGMENFQVTQSPTSLNQCLLPSDSFLKTFEYKKSQYNYRGTYRSKWSLLGKEQVIIILEYESDTYEAAKLYCLEAMTLSNMNVFEYNDFVFIENISLAADQGRVEDGKNINYPYWFNMFAYNDEEHCLIFMGFYAHDSYRDDAQIAVNNWGEFINTHYSEFYDFGSRAKTQKSGLTISSPATINHKPVLSSIQTA